MEKTPLVLLLIFYSFSLLAQQDTIVETDTLRQYAINLYMDEVPDFVKREIPFFNYVRDINDADLVMIITMEQTGSGGDEITLFIEGQYKFAGVSDTIKINLYPGETEAQDRVRIIRILKIGLMKYMMDSPLAEYIDITFTQPISEEVTSDKWNNWVFRSSVSGSINGEETSKSRYIGASISAGRVTNEWKLNTGFNFNNSQTDYNYEGISASHISRSSRIWGDAVKSINDHWSVGLSTDFYNSIYSNYDLQFSLEPSIEYDIFPYSESTRRIFRIYYIFRFGYHDYTDTTQFFKTEEVLWSHRLQTSFTTIQKWGNINLHAGWSNYLHDFSLNNLSLHSSVDLRIAKGLNISLGAGYSFIHDQVSLRKGNASPEDVLLHRHELSTTYSFYTHFGLTYIFGSIYNNIVNPRLNSLF
jgi:hypothetical protein